MKHRIDTRLERLEGTLRHIMLSADEEEEISRQRTQKWRAGLIAFGFDPDDPETIRRIGNPIGKKGGENR